MTSLLPRRMGSASPPLGGMMTETHTVAALRGDDANALLDILPALWRQKQIIIGITLAALFLAIIYLHLARPTYTVVLQVTPVGGSRSGLSERVSSLAGLAGINLPGDQSMLTFSLYQQGLTSRDTAAALLTDDRLMHRMFPAEWNAVTKQWQAPTSPLDAIRGPVKALLAVKEVPWSPPDAARVQAVLARSVFISKTRESPIVTISTQQFDPDYGRDLLAAVSAASDNLLRAKTLRRSSSYISYLNDRLRTTTVDEYREALLASIAEQEKQRMAASSDLPFAADPAGAPTASPRPTKPMPLSVIALGMIGGLFAGMVVALLRDRAQRH